MGISCCKHKGFLRDPYVSAPTTDTTGPSSSSERSKPPKNTSDSKMVDSLVLETLGVIGSLVDNEQEPPFSLVKLRIITDKEEGWIQMVSSMVKVIPLENAMGPSVITLLLDDCPLPSKESVIRVSQLLNLSGARARTEPVVVAHERNIFVVLGCIAEKLAGPNSIAILTEDTLDYLLTFIESYRLDPRVVLHALIAIEKFAQTTENKVSIKRKLLELETNPLLDLETKTQDEDYVWRQVGFCAQWNLDNLFMIDGRKYSHETVDMSRINVMLNTRDVSEYLKISPDGLEARSDSYSFESVRCTYQVDTGRWYYEAEIVTSGVMQIGWATKNSHFLNHDGYGIGDDLFSVSYDGCRRLVWHNAHSEPQTLPTWKPGDILGCLLDLEKMEAIFAINGNRIKPFYKIFENARTGFFAGASFMSFQQCRFNFGSEPFKFPPTDRHFFSFNRFGYVRPEDKVVIPRHIYLERLRQITVPEDSCTLCYDRTANIILIPCKHKGFCAICISQLRDCPMCRGRILATKQEPPPLKGAGASNYEGPYGASTSKAASNYNFNSSNGIGISKSAGSYRSAALPKNGVNWKAVGPSKSAGSYKFSRTSGPPRLAAGLRNMSDPRLDEMGHTDGGDETGHSEDGDGFHTEHRLNKGDSFKGSDAPASVLGACEEESLSDNATPVNDDKEKPGSEMPTHENTDNT